MTTFHRNHLSTAANPARAGQRSIARTRGLRALAVLGAAAAALAIWAIADPLAGIDLTVRTDGTTQPVGPVSTFTSALLAGLAAWALLAVLERVVRRPRRTWTINALVALAVSLAGPLIGGAATTATVILVGMHLAVGAVLLVALGRTARS